MRKAIFIKGNVGPVFEHDCDGCRFVGRLNGEDLYACKKADGTVEYLCRFGDEGHENGSLGDLAPPGSPYALARALLAKGGRPAEWRSDRDPGTFSRGARDLV